jgi:hypothetical protein
LNLNFAKPYRFRILLGILLVLFAVVPFFEKRLFTDLMATALLIFALSAISDSRRQLIAGSLVALFAIAAIWMVRWFPGKQLIIGADGLISFSLS